MAKDFYEFLSGGAFDWRSAREENAKRFDSEF